MIDEKSLQFIKDHAGEPYKWLAAKTGYCQGTVRTALKKLGLYDARRIINDDVIKYVLSHKDKPIKEVAETLGISYASVNQIRLKHGIRQHKKHICRSRK